MNWPDLIEKRRKGEIHTEQELRLLAKAAATGEIGDDDLAAWLMAAYQNPLNDDETAWLTLGMADSGERLDLSGLPHPWVDKHSTGGVGDKTTLVVLPILAAAGLTMVKMSGRGLGITGGTVDKLASVPGFRLDLSPAELKAQAGRIGIAWSAQTSALAPADKRMYAIRDAIGAVASMPLIVSSILSKKLAGGAEIVVLDVKCGSGAFMRTMPEAQALATLLTSTAIRCGLKAECTITDMSQPLGRTIGNAIEVREAIETLEGRGGRFRDFCLAMASHALEVTGSPGELAEQVLDSGAALVKCVEWFTAQGALKAVFESQDALPLAQCEHVVTASSDGWVAKLDAETFGLAAIDLGAGRRQKDDAIDPRVGIELFAEVGDNVAKGQPLVKIYARSGGDSSDAADSLGRGIEISAVEVARTPLILAGG